MAERFVEWNQCYKTGEDRYKQGKFEEDSWQNAKLEVTSADLVQGF